MITRRRFLTGLGTVFAFGLGGAAYSIIIEPRFRLSIAQWVVEHPHWPPAMRPLRIVVLTDIHAVEPWMPVSRIERIVDAANGLNADLILLLGDFVSALRAPYRSGLVAIADWSAALAGLRAPLGVYAVLGNHDWWLDGNAVRRGLEAQNIPVLENEAIKLTSDTQTFWLAGLADQLAIPVSGGYQGLDDLPGTLAIMAGDADPAILMAHEPDIFVKVPKRVTLTLAGHTHGGQVRLPLVGAPIVPSRYGQRFAYGHIVEEGRHLVVSSGLGLSSLPVRFMAPPEIAVVTLTSPGRTSPDA